MKISIVTVCYNSAATLSKTLESVLSQSYPNVEMVIKDGGSKDGTLDVLKHFEPLFNGRLKWKSEKDGGIYDAMNAGIKMATGDVVGILNSDDYFTSSDVIETIADSFSKQSIDAVYGDIHFVRQGSPQKIARYYSSKLFHPFWLRFGFMPAHPSFYVRKRVYDRYGGYRTDMKIGSDFEMMVRLFRRYHIKAKYIPMDFVTMLMGGASTAGFSSHLLLAKEDVRACKLNGIYSNQWMMYMKYLYKLFEFRFSL